MTIMGVNIMRQAPVVLVSVFFDGIVADFSSHPCKEYSSAWDSPCVSRASGKIGVRLKKI